MYESAISQVYTLCSLASMSINTVQNEFSSALVRARIFWYSHVHEGITTGLRGGRLHLSDEDLEAFQVTLPPIGNNESVSTTNFHYNFAYRLATTPIRLSSACRQVHACLTGPKARRSDDINEALLKDAWEALENCWQEFEQYRSGTNSGPLKPEDCERFVSGWQIFIFECHNIIREALKQRIVSTNTSRISPISPSNDRSPHLQRLKVDRLHAIAESKCLDRVRDVVSLIRRHLGTSFFEYDASLTRDGVFFASFLLAEGGGSQEDLDVCIQALRQYRWAFSKSEEREQTLRMVRDSHSKGSKYPSQERREDSNSPYSSSNSASSSIPPSANTTAYDDQHAVLSASPQGVARPASARSSMISSTSSSHGSPISVESLPVLRPITASSRSSTQSADTSRSSGPGTRVSQAFMTNDPSGALSIVTSFPPALPYVDPMETQYGFHSPVPQSASTEPPPPSGSTLSPFGAPYFHSSEPYNANRSPAPQDHDDPPARSSASSGSFTVYNPYNLDYYLP